MKTFKSTFGKQLVDYINLRRGLGLKFVNEEGILRNFDQYIYECGCKGPLTQDLALAFATRNPNVMTAECGRRYQIIRGFSEYLATFDPSTPCLDPKALRRCQKRPPPYIYSEDELDRLLNGAQHISSKNPMRGRTLFVMVGLTASSGLRVSEVVKLDKADVDLNTGVLTILRSKFGKDRLVPVHSTTLNILRDYAMVRDTAYPDCDCPAFFINRWGQRFAAKTLQDSFIELARKVGLRGPKGKGPSYHSLRHTFAVMRMVAWYKEGADVQAMLPALATYMGHACYTDTAYYITATAELMGLAADKFFSTLRIREVRS